MKKNIGKLDKNVRIIVGVVFLLLGYFTSPWFFVLAIISLGTAFVGRCGLYSLFGINTCKIEAPKEDAVN